MFARNEFAARRKIAQAERKAMERDLELARGIQDSLAAPAVVESDSLVTRCFQKRHSTVGGDWVGIRPRTGGVMVVVADATGKGVQAALVIHAVQALWAEALGDERFEPLRWLERVNAALLRMGEKQPHSLTLGLVAVDVKACKLTYWSAGHLPIFLVERSSAGGGSATVRAIAGVGNPLGIVRDARVVPVTAELPVGDHWDLLLGTDGVFPKGTVHRRAELLKFRDRVELVAERALDECHAEDDKTLVWVKVA